MVHPDISVIVPVRNIEEHISDIINGLAKEINGMSVEIIIIDMGSNDKTVFNSLTSIKREGIAGRVVQSGHSAITTALNAGIAKAQGLYVTFCFIRKQYSGFYCQFLHTAQEFNADIVFGAVPEHGEKALLNALPGDIDQCDLVTGVVESLISIDLGALLVKREFMKAKRVLFTETCRFGFSEEFIFRAILAAECIHQEPQTVMRNSQLEPPAISAENLSGICFDKIDALIRIEELIKSGIKYRQRLIALFTDQKIPDAVLSCADILIKEGYSINGVKSALKLKKFDEYLKAGSRTPPKLKRELLLFNRLPWLYKPR